MHLDHDHLGGEAHSHEHAHTHEHSHAYAHEHEHTHADGTVHAHPHDHSYSHSHEHTDHVHAHEHEHPEAHEHSHECSQNCESCGTPCEHTPMEELTALMRYMVGHNAAHARELADLAKQLDEAGSHTAYEQVMAAVSDFEKGNLRLSTVLASLDA